MSWFSALLGTDQALKTIDTIAGKGLDLADNAFYTDQEKAQVRMKSAANFIEFQKLVATQSSPTAISRRIIAWAVMSIVFASFVIGCILIGLDKLVMLSHFMDLINELWVGEAFTAVICFYFGAHLFGVKK